MQQGINDVESAEHYNYFRDYDPGIGRYVESDPIGLTGGLNTYGYVENSPILLSDPAGLMGFGPGGTRGSSSATATDINFGRLKHSCEAPCQHPVTMHFSNGRGGTPRTKTYDWHCLITFAAVGKGGGATTTNWFARQAPNWARALGLGEATVGAASAAWLNPYFGAGVLALGSLEVFDECSCGSNK